MTPRTLHVRGINSLVDLTVDFSQIGPGTCAIVGDNGVGKSTLLACMLLAPVYRRMPAWAGSFLDSCAPQRDVMIDLTHDYGGHKWRHVVQVNAALKHPTTTANLFRDGIAIDHDDKTGTYDQAIAEHFPPPDLVMASAFAASRGMGSFAQLDAADRRRLLRQMLPGLDEMQGLSGRSGEHRKDCGGYLQQLARDEERLRATEASAAELDEQISVEALKTDGLRDSAAEADKANTAAQVALQTAQDGLSKAAEARTEMVRKRGALDLRIRDATDRLESDRKSLKDAESVTAQAEQIRADHEVAQKLDRDLWTAREDYRNADELLSRNMEETHANNRSQAQRSAEDVERRIAAAEEAQVGIELLDARAAALAKAREGRPELAERIRADSDAAQAASVAFSAAASAAQGATLAHAAAQKAAAQIDAVPCGGRVLFAARPAVDPERPVDCSACSFLTSAIDAKGALRVLADAASNAEYVADNKADDMNDTEKRAATMRRKLTELDAEIAELAGAGARLESARAKVAELTGMRIRAAEIQATISDCDDGIVKARAKWTEHTQKCDAAEAAGTEARTALDALDGWAQRFESLASAETRIPLLREAVTDHTAARNAAQAELDAMEIPPEPEELREGVAVLIARCAVVADEGLRTRTVLDGHLDRLARLRGHRGALGDFASRLAQVSEARATIGKRRAGLALLEHAMGPTGVQAHEIDAAGPGVSDIANELMQVLAPGYTMQMRTQTDGAGRKKATEVLDAIVTKPDGTRVELGRLSDGERVMVEEPIKLAIAVFVAKSTGTQLQTLWRDEGDGALASHRAARYPAMLRAAMDLGGFDRCFFITHRPDVAAQADHILHVGAGGKVTILDPEEYTSNAAIAAK